MLKVSEGGGGKYGEKKKKSFVRGLETVWNFVAVPDSFTTVSELQQNQM